MNNDKKSSNPKPYGSGGFRKDSRGYGHSPANRSKGGFVHHDHAEKSTVKPVLPVNKTARYAAFMAFEDVMNKDTYASMALDARFKEISLSQADKKLAAAITYGTLENLIGTDWIIDGYLKDKDSLPQQIIDILRISVCQLFFMSKIPENAVVDEAVKLTRFVKLETLTGVVNAVLRNILREKETIKYPDPETDRAAYLSVRYSMPEWIIRKLTESYGDETAEKICAYRPEKHSITLRSNIMRFSDERFEKEVLGKKVWLWEKADLPHAYLVNGISDLARDADYLAGHYSVQGLSSQLCVLAADVKPGMKVLDCCSAPGGKTAYMAEIMNGTGRVYAWDLHEHRVALIRAMQKRLGLENIRPAVRDACIPKDDMIGTMDTVLLDAPCSNLGVMDDKPDVKFRLKQENITELVKTQEKLLDICSTYVRPGGVFIYSTCSVLPDENKEQIKRFLAAHSDFHISKLTTIPDTFAAWQDEYGLQLLNYRDHTEGFFIAKMVRDR